jgi:repressor LexA
MTTLDLTPRQRDVLEVIERALSRNGYPPTRAEIATALGFRSANAAQEHLQALQRKGLIAIDGSHRGIRVLRPSRTRRAQPKAEASNDALDLPLIGRVAAGAPILASEHVEARYRCDAALFPARPDFLLAVRGDSMRDAGVLDGDLVAVRSTREARNGQMVVARIDDEATVKTFERRGARVRLLPANPAYAPIELDLERVPLVIEGLVVGLVRRAPGVAR